MPSFKQSGPIRRRFLRLISFGRYSSDSADDLEPLTTDGSRRHSAPADLEEQSSRPVYTAHQSPQSTDSAQTTIVHGVPAGKAPFAIPSLRDLYRGRVISDAEFDTPPSLEAAQETIHPAEPKRVMGPRHGFPRPTATRHLTGTMPTAGATPWPTIRDPIGLRRDKSYLQCNVCSGVLEYSQIHCPGCAARTLHHIPGLKEDTDPNANDDIAGPKILQPKKQRQNEHPDAATEESSWDTQGLEGGTVEESWTTTTADAIDTASPSSNHTQEATSQSTGPHEPHIRYCCCDTGVTLIHHGCCGISSTYATAAVIFIGPAPESRSCKFWKRGSPPRHVCLRIWGQDSVDIFGEAQRCKCGEGKQGEVLERKTWWMRWSRLFCCC